MIPVRRDRDAAAIQVEPLERLTKGDAAAIGDEGSRLLAFIGADVERLDVRIASPG